MNKRLLSSLLVGLLMLSGVMVAAQDTPGTIADIVVASTQAESPEFTSLLAAVQAADPAVLEALSNPEAQLTVFAPTDAAFAALGEETLSAVLADQALLTDILLFHVIEGSVMSADVVASLEAQTMMEATPEATAEAEMMEAELPSFSVPTLQGQYIDIAADGMGGITVNGANLNLEMVDIAASNGVIHVIDAVILPETRTIADIVVESAGMAEGAEFTSLLAAVQAADPAVLTTLSDPEAELTVFAPTDAAFAALGEETLNAVLADQAQLTSILLYHVVPGVVHSGDVTALLEENAGMVTVDTALEGAQVEIAGDAEMGITINGANIVVTDIDAGNGVIHVIDAVILPPAE
jgi:transforming growth factor-beta-induced protein